MLDAWSPDPQAHRTQEPEPSDDVVRRLLDAIRGIDRSTSLTEILDDYFEDEFIRTLADGDSTRLRP